VFTAAASSAAGQGVDLATLRIPAGFEIDVYAEGIADARQLAVANDGLVFVGSRRMGKVYAVVDRDGDYRADEIVVVAEGLRMPSGVALHDGALYVAAVDRILRFDRIADTFRARPLPHVVYGHLPDAEHHGWKYLGFGPDGKLYVPVGAPCNVCLEPAPFASILRMSADGRQVETVARGVRNSVGFTWHPDTGKLWFTDNGRDGLGDDLPSCELNRVDVAGQHFGFPYLHGANVQDPDFHAEHPLAEFTPPVLELGAHVAPLGLLFYSGKQFPPDYRHNLLIAEHGSWDRSEKSGYRVMRVTFDTNGMVQGQQPLVSGWLQGQAAWGRPVDLAGLADGSVLISDDTAGLIYRLHYAASPRGSADEH
jgi:glucose/arabinose dehydrogenase